MRRRRGDGGQGHGGDGGQVPCGDIARRRPEFTVAAFALQGRLRRRWLPRRTTCADLFRGCRGPEYVVRARCRHLSAPRARVVRLFHARLQQPWWIGNRAHKGLQYCATWVHGLCPYVWVACTVAVFNQLYLRTLCVLVGKPRRNFIQTACSESAEAPGIRQTRPDSRALVVRSVLFTFLSCARSAPYVDGTQRNSRHKTINARGREPSPLPYKTSRLAGG